LDPFYAAGSKVLHVDAMLATLMTVSMLFLLRYHQEGHWKPLVFGGLFAGLSFLTKGPSLFLIPYAACAVVYRYVKESTGLVSLSDHRLSPDRTTRMARDLVLWGGTAVFVFVLLWPAAWVMPGEALSTMAERVVFHAETVHRNPNFFAGRAIQTDPGPLFYLATVSWKTTLITLPALLGAVFFLVRRAKHWRENETAWWLLIFVGGFAIAMAFAARKEMRYLLPVFPALDVLAAWGLVHTADAVGKLKQLKRYRYAPSMIIAAVLVTQAAAVLRLHPYYGAHHNLLLGGSRVAQHILPLGDQGEGQDLAARFLASFPRAEERMVGVHRRYEELFERIFPGRSEGLEDPYIDYYVFAINSIQRQNRLDLWDDAWELCQQKTPLWTASFDGVTYAWIYGGFESDAAAFAIEQAMDVDIGAQVRLLGYTLSSSEPLEEEPLTVTLFWQSDGRLVEDYHVFVHLLDQHGEMVAQHDGVPMQGQRPTWDWRYREVIEDQHVISLGETEPRQVYGLYVGMYDYKTKERLPVSGPDGEALSDDRIALERVRVVDGSGADS
jgi:hypothetical protein